MPACPHEDPTSDSARAGDRAGKGAATADASVWLLRAGRWGPRAGPRRKGAGPGRPASRGAGLRPSAGIHACGDTAAPGARVRAGADGRATRERCRTRATAPARSRTSALSRNSRARRHGRTGSPGPAPESGREPGGRAGADGRAKPRTCRTRAADPARSRAPALNRDTRAPIRPHPGAGPRSEPGREPEPGLSREGVGPERPATPGAELRLSAGIPARGDTAAPGARAGLRSCLVDQTAASGGGCPSRAVQATGEHRKAEDRRCGWPGRTWTIRQRGEAPCRASRARDDTAAPGAWTPLRSPGGSRRPGPARSRAPALSRDTRARRYGRTGSPGPTRSPGGSRGGGRLGPGWGPGPP